MTKSLRHILIFAAPLSGLSQGSHKDAFVKATFTLGRQESNVVFGWDQITIEIICDDKPEGHILRTGNFDWKRSIDQLLDLYTSSTGLPVYLLSASSYGEDTNIRVPFQSAPEMRNYPHSYQFNVPASAFKANPESIQIISSAFFNELDIQGEILSAARLYRVANEVQANMPDLAYSLYVSSLECLALTVRPTDEELYDQESLKFLNEIRAHADFGQKPYRFLKGRMRQLKKRVCLAVKHYMVKDIYDQLIPKDGYDPKGLLRYKPLHIHDIDLSLSAAYNLRSKHLHTGLDHSSWTRDYAGFSNSEIPKEVANAPSISSLKTLVQHCLSNAICRQIHTLSQSESGPRD